MLYPGLGTSRINRHRWGVGRRPAIPPGALGIRSEKGVTCFLDLATNPVQETETGGP